MLEISKSCHACADRDDIEIRDLVILFLHLVTTVAKLYGRGGERSVVAESVLLKHQLLIVGPEYWAPIEFSVINIVNSAGFHDPLDNSSPSARSISSPTFTNKSRLFRNSPPTGRISEASGSRKRRVRLTAFLQEGFNCRQLLAIEIADDRKHLL